MIFIHSIFQMSPEIALFIALALGAWIGKFKFGKFQLGGVAGALIVSVILSQFGITIDDGIKGILFALFIYAVGFESGPQFFRSLGIKSIKEIILSVVLAASGFATVIVLAKIYALDKGTAAGIAAGALTQSAIIGTASSAIDKLGLSPDITQHLQSNVAIGYAVTYIFGSLGAIIICVNILPLFMHRDLREDAVKAEAELLNGEKNYAAGQSSALPELVGRVFKAQRAAGQTVSQIEDSCLSGKVTIERIKRSGKIIGLSPSLVIQKNDVLLVVGRRSGMIYLDEIVGPEINDNDGMEMVIATRDIIVTSKHYTNKTISELLSTNKILRHGIYFIKLSRSQKSIPLLTSTIIRSGDVVTVYGLEEDIQRLAQHIGPVIPVSEKTDFIYHGIGVAVGLLIGLAVVHLGAIPLTLGAGGGALFSGLIFGWYRSRHMVMGNMPSAASGLLKDLGLAGFVAVVGLQSGQQAIHTIAENGISIFFIGVAVTIIPLIITMIIGRYILRYDNTAIFAGALSGTRSANPAFGEILVKAGNSVPTVPFAITYALANVFLTLLGPLIVAFV
ncbi:MULTISPECIES: aspartate-alanine antiporter [Klebsiella pneumoniae complex]|uniref:aspartate-alanine antiporter n=1 Tax=Klebsiella pneumoniae complex TaxID=3390273 RepID=UPI00238014F0|nr:MULTISPECIES: aspartate-alanine antiporter [Klebsiella]MDE4740301.1 aspartate-alanine antiporter [Klebsiella pneumoniae]MDE4750034.1 aspartate-alanine antiporter [Klebsiella pneumoniae]MDE4766075.1 aspartate-alanine antiporter [Klebsiella pneumoniae]MDE4792292.1 aspartate-alanine antiporter [Klebsiella pneumoniae]MDE4797064.1 aspartate-alanine antiporter [Klebsiella quasipneumoniae subsp. similipneumoniae]